VDIKAYLERIRYTGSTEPLPEVLSALQRQHLLHVPFENLDIHYKVTIDPANSYTKVVLMERGGFCYGLNGLFYELLKEMGFVVKLVSARVYDSEKGYGPEFDHMAIIATCNDGDYLVDVGFGEFSFHPLKIELDKEQPDPRGVFRIEAYDKDYLVVEKKNAAGEFIPEYIFSENQRQPEDFLEMCTYKQTSPESHFTQKRVCSLSTYEGRITLKGNILKITTGDTVTEKELATEADIEQALWDHFKIKIQA
jgi:N-hydroxyarylamine O-acetyltransferase